MKNMIFWGKIKRGARRGKRLGFPTANVALHKEISEGVYISVVSFYYPTRPSTSLRMEKLILPAATFIGGAKTFGEKKYQTESFILDFNKDIYGKWISVRLIKKIHANIKFSGEKTLVAQMKKDVLEVQEYFRKYSK